MFCFVRLRSPKSHASCRALCIYWKLLTSKGAPTWFETAWSYDVEVVDYWTIFSMKKREKLKLKKLLEFVGNSWLPWEALDKSDFIESISQFSHLRCGFWIGCCSWKFKKVATIGFKRKNQVHCQCVHFAEFRNFQLWKSEKIKNVFRLGRKAQATIVYLKTYYYMLCILLDL